MMKIIINYRNNYRAVQIPLATRERHHRPSDNASMGLIPFDSRNNPIPEKIKVLKWRVHKLTPSYARKKICNACAMSIKTKGTGA